MIVIDYHIAASFMEVFTHERIMKCLRAVMLNLILIASILFVTTPAVNAQTDEIVIDSTVEWVEDLTLDSNLRITSGGHLTINGITLDIADSVTVLVEDGGNLSVVNSQIVADNPPTGLAGYGYWDEVNRSAVLIPGSDYDGPFDATFTSGAFSSFYGSQAMIEGQDPIDLNGSEFTLSFDGNTDDVWVGLVGYGHQSVHLATVTMTPDLGSSITYDAIDLQHMNMMALDTDQNTCNFVINGEASFDEISLLGCEIDVNGIMLIDDSDINRVGPIISNENAYLSIYGHTTFTMSKDDHDVRAHANSELLWGNYVNGSGGLTDRWELRIANQYVQFDAKDVLFRILKMGPQEITSSTYSSDENGIGMIAGGEERVVGIGWADGTEWNEQALIEIIDYRVSWNMDPDLPNYGVDRMPVTMDQQIIMDSNIPHIEFVSLEYSNSENEASISAGVGMIATIANRGDAPAVVFLDCEITETGLSTDVGSFPGGEKIDPNTEVMVQFQWRHYSEENAGITCEVLTPTQLVEDDAFGGGSASATSLDWYQPDSGGDASILPVIIAISLGVVIMGLYIYRSISNKDEEEELF